MDNAALDCVCDISTSRSAAAALQRDLPSIFPVDCESLSCIVEDEPAGVVIYLGTHKNQAICDQLDRNVQGRNTG